MHLERYGHLGRPGIAVHIREGLPNDPENGPLHDRDGDIRCVVNSAGELQARTLSEALNEVPHRG